MTTIANNSEQTTAYENISLFSIVLAIWKQRVIFCLISAIFMGFGAYLFINTKTEYTLTFSVTADEPNIAPLTKEWNGLIMLVDFWSTSDVTRQQNGSISFSKDFQSDNKIEPLDLLAEYHVLFSKQQRVRKSIRHVLETDGGLSGDLLERAVKKTLSSITVGKIYKINEFTHPNAMNISIKSADPLLAGKIIKRISADILLEIKANLANETDAFLKMLEKSNALKDRSRDDADLGSNPQMGLIVTELRMAQKLLVSRIDNQQLVAFDYDYPEITASMKRFKLLVLFSCLGLVFAGIIALTIQTFRQNIGNISNGN